MTKKALDEKYSYQIDEHDVVHLFRGEDDCQQYLTNPLLSAIFKIETLEKENVELKKKVLEFGEHLDLIEREWERDTAKLIHFKTQSAKAKELLKTFLGFAKAFCYSPSMEKFITDTEQFLKENEE